MGSILGSPYFGELPIGEYIGEYRGIAGCRGIDVYRVVYGYMDRDMCSVGAKRGGGPIGLEIQGMHGYTACAGLACTQTFAGS